jgi:carboxymethylenebutenolidase
MPVAFFESGDAEYIDTENLNAPLIVVLMDAIGIREELREVARALNELGYCVALPNLYYREGRCEDMDFSTPDGQQKVMSLYTGLSHEMVRADMKYLLASLAHDQPVGLLGYCMGGANALVLAGTYPKFIKAAAAIHPGGIVSDAADSPDKMAPAAQGELYIAIADEDPYATAEQVAVLDSALKQAGVSYELECYQGAAHGFSFKSLPSYNVEAAARYWQATVALFERTLS